MQIFIMRHGQASFQASTDAQRELTKQGERESQKMGQWLAANGFIPDTIWVSPFVRAQQTCQQVISQFIPLSSPVTLPLITPTGQASQVKDFIDGELFSKPQERVLIVSHMPLVCYLIDEFTQHQEAPVFQTAAMGEIDYNVNSMMGQLTRLISPNQLSH